MAMTIEFIYLNFAHAPKMEIKDPPKEPSIPVPLPFSRIKFQIKTNKKITYKLHTRTKYEIQDQYEAHNVCFLTCVFSDIKQNELYCLRNIYDR